MDAATVFIELLDLYTPRIPPNPAETLFPWCAKRKHRPGNKMVFKKYIYLETILVSRKQNLLRQQFLRNSILAAMFRLRGP